MSASSGDWRAHAAMIAAAALVTGAAWMIVVPPFEGTDELYFYNRAREFMASPERRELLVYRLAAPIIRVMSPAAEMAAPEYNPAFAFVSNRRGEVNRFAHDRPVATREHVRTLLALRGVVVLLGAVTVLLIYAIARVSLPDPSLAPLVACVALWVPQFCFVNATFSTEAITRLVAAAVTLVVVGRATGRVSRLASWVLLPVAIAAVPLVDRQALFLAPFAALALVMTERTWKARAVAAVAVVAPVAAAVIVLQHAETGTDLSPWWYLTRHPFLPFTTVNTGRGWLGTGGPYYAYEFFPKLFEGFWGWLGQPSILLPAWLFAGILVAMLAAAAGLVLRLRHPAPATDDQRQRQLARRLMAAGIVLMWLPIIYGPAIAGLNLWYGRWLFAMLGPIAVFLVLGVEEFFEVAARRPYRTAAAILIVTAIAAAVWLTSTGADLRAGMNSYHYGDRPRLIAIVDDSVIGLGILAGAIALAARAGVPRPRASVVLAVCAALAVANAVLLTAFVRPLYAPMTADDYGAQIARYIDAHETARAANLYVSAVKSHPQSAVLRSLADQTPSLLLGGNSPSARALFWQWLARGNTLRDRDALLMLANDLRRSGASLQPSAAGALAGVLAGAEEDPDLAEAVALVRIALAHDAAETGQSAIDAGRGTRLDKSLHKGEFVIVGFTSRRAAAGGTQLIVYFRVHGDLSNRRLWVHAHPYPIGGPSFVTPDAVLAPEVWVPGQLMWAMYELPPGVYVTYAGEFVGNDPGEGALLGLIQ